VLFEFENTVPFKVVAIILMPMYGSKKNHIFIFSTNANYLFDEFWFVVGVASRRFDVKLLIFACRDDDN